MAAGGLRYLIMKRIKPWLVLALVFLAGLALGVVATRIAVRKFVQTAITQPDKLRDRIELRMSRRLALTPEQRQRLVTEASSVCRQGKATDLDTLFKQDALWAEEWGNGEIGRKGERGKVLQDRLTILFCR